MSVDASRPAAQRPLFLQLMSCWSGRLILIHTIVFLAISALSGSLFAPESKWLILFGAKDISLIATGEWWRLLAPMFLHIGIIHFAFNNLMLWVIGRQIEEILGARTFLSIYFFSGFASFVASAYMSIHLSAGASGAIFGLLGSGFFIEWKMGQYLESVGAPRQKRAYAATVGINLLFGFLMPFVDNAAHVGGLVAGMLMTWAILVIRPNRLLGRNPVLGWLLVACGFLMVGVGTAEVVSPRFQMKRLLENAAATDDPLETIYVLDKAIAIDPHNSEVVVLRAKALYQYGDNDFAMVHVKWLVQSGHPEKLQELVRWLESNGKLDQASKIREFQGSIRLE